jgi:hypothetical protein
MQLEDKTMLKTFIAPSYRILAVALVMAACGPKLKDVEEDKEGSDPKSEDLTFLEIPAIVHQNSEELALADADRFTIDLEDCATSHTASATEVTASLQVYKNDKGCLAKLKVFTYLGDAYLPSSGDPFETWTAGDTATYESLAGSLKVTVLSQLSNPVADADVIAYEFSQIAEGDVEPVPSDSRGHAISVSGQPAPNFSIFESKQIDIDTTGAGIFQFTMQCEGTLTGTAAAGNLACDGLALNKVTFKLIEDTYSSVLTMSDAQTIFQAGEITLNPSSYRDANAGTGYKGGFVVTATGPAQMHTHPHMLLTFEGNNTSYLYFNIDLQVIP